VNGVRRRNQRFAEEKCVENQQHDVVERENIANILASRQIPIYKNNSNHK
jgi:hypothetical protein